MTIDQVREAYARRTAEYVEVVGRIDHADEADRRAILAWAQGTGGPILDVGCGPGQWTNLLHGAGLDVEGIDPVEAFLEDARARYPAARFRTGCAEDLGVPDGSLGGVLAWFSLIHTDPAAIDVALAALARSLRVGGSLAIGFFDGPAREPFDHAVVTAYYWSVEALTEVVERAGMTVTDARTRHRPPARPQGLLLARRSI